MSVAYSYDALNRSTHRTEGDITTTFSYQGTSEEVVRVVERTNSTGAASTTDFAQSPGGPLGQRRGTEIRYLLRDLHADVVGVADPVGIAKGSVAYSPWGERRSSSGEQALLGFQSDLTDPGTGLVDMTARNYDPALGRFTSRDVLFGELSSPLSVNQFIYGMGSPIATNDPTGMLCLGGPCPAPIASGGGGGGGGGGASGCLDALSCGAGQGTTFEPEPNPPALDLKLKEFIAMSVNERITWLKAFSRVHASAFGSEDWFNAILGVLRFASETRFLEPGSWASVVDAHILFSVQEGMKLARGDMRSTNNPAAAAWGVFFRKRDAGADEDLSKFLWSRAETLATKIGRSLAEAAGLSPTTGELSVYNAANFWRGRVADPVGTRWIGAVTGSMSAPFDLAEGAVEGAKGFDSIFDPRNEAAGYYGSYGAWSLGEAWAWP